MRNDVVDGFRHVEIGGKKPSDNDTDKERRVDFFRNERKNYRDDRRNERPESAVKGNFLSDGLKSRRRVFRKVCVFVAFCGVFVEIAYRVVVIFEVGFLSRHGKREKRKDNNEYRRKSNDFFCFHICYPPKHPKVRFLHKKRTAKSGSRFFA